MPRLLMMWLAMCVCVCVCMSVTVVVLLRIVRRCMLMLLPTMALQPLITCVLRACVLLVVMQRLLMCMVWLPLL